MKLRFWGVRGSCPTPLSSQSIQEKITAIINRIKPEDMVDQIHKERFISRLPEELFGTTGGNTSCVEVRLLDNTLLIFDCGTGIRELFFRLVQKSELDGIDHFHIFFSHFHYDHLIGLPYFPPLFMADKEVTFYSPFREMEKILKAFLRKPYHPVGFEVFKAKVNYRLLKREPLELGSATIDWIKRNHPDGTIAYRVKEGKKIAIYSTDTELDEQSFKMTRKNMAFFHRADFIILDAQYTLVEALEKMSWGHSSFSLAIEFACQFEISRLFLFHHEPMNNDKIVVQLEKQALSFKNHLKHPHGRKLKIELAREGTGFEV